MIHADRDQGVEQDDDGADGPQDLLRCVCTRSMAGYLLSGLAPRKRKKMNAMIITQKKIRIDDRRSEPEVEPVDELLVAEDRHRVGVVGAAGDDERGVVDPERVERAEQHRDHQRGPDQRQRDLDEALPRARAVHLRGLVEVVRHERQAAQQQQGDERRRLPDLRR